VNQELEYHPLADLFPLMEGEEFAELVADIRANGLQQPIWHYEGKILDGRNRYRACIEAGIPTKYHIYSGTDPLSFVVSLNMKRRHLTDSQRAMIADKIATLPKGANQHAQIRAPSQAKAAEMLNVSRTSVETARKVREKGGPELVKEVETGKKTLGKAVKTLVLRKADGSTHKLAVTTETIRTPIPKIRVATETKKIPILPRDPSPEQLQEWEDASDVVQLAKDNVFLKNQNARLTAALDRWNEGAGATPLERAKAAYLEMSDDEKNAFAAWVNDWIADNKAPVSATKEAIADQVPLP
jgi:ParB-like chromosome segregation protein Spo0J